MNTPTNDNAFALSNLLVADLWGDLPGLPDAADDWQRLFEIQIKLFGRGRMFTDGKYKPKTGYKLIRFAWRTAFECHRTHIDPTGKYHDQHMQVYVAGQIVRSLLNYVGATDQERRLSKEWFAALNQGSYLATFNTDKVGPMPPEYRQL